MRLVALVASCVALCFVAGCSLFMRSIEKPKAEVRGVSVSSAGFSGLTGELALDVTNPNRFGVPLSGMDWQLSVGGARAVTGSVQLNQTIPALGVAPVTTTLSIDARDAIAVGRVLARGARDYQLQVRLYFSTSIGQLHVDVAHVGTLGGTGIAALTAR